MTLITVILIVSGKINIHEYANKFYARTDKFIFLAFHPFVVATENSLSARMANPLTPDSYPSNVVIHFSLVKLSEVFHLRFPHFIIGVFLYDIIIISMNYNCVN